MLALVVDLSVLREVLALVVVRVGEVCGGRRRQALDHASRPRRHGKGAVVAANLEYFSKKPSFKKNVKLNVKCSVNFFHNMLPKNKLDWKI